MNFLYEPAVIINPDRSVDRRVFPSLDLARKYCNQNEYCKYISNTDTDIDYIVWIDYNSEIVESKDGEGVQVLRKNRDKAVAKGGAIISIEKNELRVDQIKNKNLISADKIKLQAVVESETNCITIIYKCDNEKVKNALDFSSASLYKVIYSANPFVDFSKVTAEEGFYIARLIFFIESKDEIVNFGLYVPYTQVVLWVDNKVIQVAGNDKDSFINTNTNLLEGVHSVFVDFGFSTDKLIIEDEGEVNSVAVVPLIKSSSVGSFSAISSKNYLYERNPLLLTTILKEEKKNLMSSDKCNSSNFYKNIECMNELSNGMDRDLADQIKKQFEYELSASIPNLSLDLKNLITFLYSESDVDYETASFMKDKIESIFIQKFLNMNWSTEDIATFSFLLPLMSPLYHNYILRTEVMQKCADVESDMYKDGFCKIIESDITLLKNTESKAIIDKIIDRRDYIYCVSKTGDKYNFELDSPSTKDKCNRVIGDEKIQNYLISSKCSNVEGKWLGLNHCKQQSEMDTTNTLITDRDSYYRNVFSSKENIYRFYKGEDAEQLSDFINYTSSGSSKLEDEFVFTSPLMEICEEDELVETQCKEVYNYILNKKDKNEDVDNKYNASVKKWNANKCGRSIQAGSLDECDSAVFFNTEDPVNTLLYSNHVKKYCTENPFNSNCVDYYEKVFNSIKNNSNMLVNGEGGDGVESMENKKEYEFSWKNVIYFVLVLITSVLLVFVLRNLKENILLTRRTDNTTTNTTISTNM